MVTEDVLRKKFEHLRVAGGPILVEFYLVELCAQWYVFARNGHTQIEGTSIAEQSIGSHSLLSVCPPLLPLEIAVSARIDKFIAPDTL